MADNSGGCFQGKEIDLTQLRSPGQQEMMAALGQLLQGNLGQGASPFGGQLSMGPDDSQMAAMQTMMGKGGYGPYRPNPYPTMGGTAGTGGGRSGPDNPYPGGDFTTPGGGTVTPPPGWTPGLIPGRPETITPPPEGWRPPRGMGGWGGYGGPLPPGPFGGATWGVGPSPNWRRG